MKDLIISYRDENKRPVEKTYDTIMDFLDEEKPNITSKYTVITATFFENIRNTKSFDTFEELINHCDNITK